jgi:hypothetical protein
MNTIIDLAYKWTVKIRLSEALSETLSYRPTKCQLTNLCKISSHFTSTMTELQTLDVTEQTKRDRIKTRLMKEEQGDNFLAMRQRMAEYSMETLLPVVYDHAVKEGIEKPGRLNRRSRDGLVSFVCKYWSTFPEGAPYMPKRKGFKSMSQVELQQDADADGEAGD